MMMKNRIDPTDFVIIIATLSNRDNCAQSSGIESRNARRLDRSALLDDGGRSGLAAFKASPAHYAQLGDSACVDVRIGIPQRNDRYRRVARFICEDADRCRGEGKVLSFYDGQSDPSPGERCAELAVREKCDVSG